MRVFPQNMVEYLDVKVAGLLKERIAEAYGGKTINWLYCPPELAFRYAKQKWGESFAPLANVYRISPISGNQERNTRDAVLEGRSVFFDADKLEAVGFSRFFVDLEYQIDFFADRMNIINHFDLRWEVFRRYDNAFINLDLTPVNNSVYPEFDTTQEFFKLWLTGDRPSDNTDYESEYDAGRLFRHTYTFETTLPVIYRQDGLPLLDKIAVEVDTPVLLDGINFDIKMDYGN